MIYKPPINNLKTRECAMVKIQQIPFMKECSRTDTMKQNKISASVKYHFLLAISATLDVVNIEAKTATVYLFSSHKI